MRADIDANRAVIGTDPALHTPRRVRHHLTGGKDRVFIRIPLEKSQNIHAVVVVEWPKKLRF
jgi:hypothetical protein